MSRWQPVSDAIKKQEQSDGCGRLLVILIIAIVCIAAVFGAWKLGTHPRCWACNHFRHENRMCGSLMDGLGTCICEKDKK